MRCLPGTVIEADIKVKGDARGKISGMFIMGGIVLSQVSDVLGLEPHNVQNWIKRGFCSAPLNKRYTKRQLCRLMIINAFKDILDLSDIVSFLSYINGELDDESDDLFPDDEIYFRFIDTLRELGDRQTAEVDIRVCAERVCADLTVNKERLCDVIAVMANAYLADTFRKKAMENIKNCKIHKEEF